MLYFHATGLRCASSGRLSPANLVNSNEVRCVRRGGNVNDGANDGPLYFNANNAPSNANWNYGSALNLFQRPAWPLTRYPCKAMPMIRNKRMLLCTSFSVVAKVTEMLPAGAAQ